MQMASSSLLSLFVLVLRFSFSSAYTSDQNPISIIKAAVGDSEDPLNLNRMEAKNNQQYPEIHNVVVGPWGGSGGQAFDDGTYTGIREIDLVYNDDAVGGFQVIYDLNGSPFAGQNHTTIIKSAFTKVKIILDFPCEYIIEVSGYIGNVKGRPVIRSLKFQTNKQTYGPYGVTSDTPFNLPIKSGYIVGFLGSLGYWLDNIGFHLSA